MRHPERHRAGRGGWLRAAVLGANDGIVSTASLVLGVAAAEGSPAAVLTAGLAGLVGGAMSMAAGEYVSVSSQRDLEQGDLARERKELAETPTSELEELTGIYQEKGLDAELAQRVAVALTKHDALAVHALEELKLDLGALARPAQAAAVSALSFAAGSALALAAIVLSPTTLRLPVTLIAATAALAVLGGWSASLGGTAIRPAIVRVVIGGVAAMGLTMAVGTLFGVSM